MLSAFCCKRTPHTLMLRQSHHIHTQTTHTLHFPAVEARRAQEVVLDRVEPCPPWDPPNRGAGWRRGAGRASGAVSWRVGRRAPRGGQRAPPRGGVGGDLRVGDRLAAVVRVEVAAAEAMMVAG